MAAKLQNAILSLLDERGTGKTICPSEVARALGGKNWREQMQAVREAAFVLADRGQLHITQHGHVVHGRTATGPIRLRRREQ